MNSLPAVLRQETNPYTYVLNNPTRFRDPLGLQTGAEVVIVSCNPWLAAIVAAIGLAVLIVCLCQSKEDKRKDDPCWIMYREDTDWCMANANVDLATYRNCLAWAYENFMRCRFDLPPGKPFDPTRTY